ncbi:hypothetical protein J6TS1_14230 [Siminovitchia terrae]|uniref:Uncharacterized protein n=1 Tax=Siminovitchia terrae TaxID=1914933 RepID=A0ABQ4KU38_SIMTE|nr:hypothetical protein J6TS1_14230 [Siminovitchia terrae]
MGLSPTRKFSLYPFKGVTAINCKSSTYEILRMSEFSKDNLTLLKEDKNEC